MNWIYRLAIDWCYAGTSECYGGLIKLSFVIKWNCFPFKIKNVFARTLWRADYDYFCFYFFLRGLGGSKLICRFIGRSEPLDVYKTCFKEKKKSVINRSLLTYDPQKISVQNQIVASVHRALCKRNHTHLLQPLCMNPPKLPSLLITRKFPYRKFELKWKRKSCLYSLRCLLQVVV